MQHRIYKTSFASVYPLYVKKAENKGRTKKEVDTIILWLTGYDQTGLKKQIQSKVDFETFFANAPKLNPKVKLITGVICGVRIEDIKEPLMKKIRYLDKLIDELAKGKKMEVILRSEDAAKPAKAPARKSKKPVLLAGGNPQIAKGEGDGPIQAYIKAMPGWKRAVGERIDKIVAQVVPKAHKAVKWNSPFYGNEGDGWFLNFHCFTKYVKVAFFKGNSLRPIPPGESTHKDVRYLNIYEGEFDEKQFAAWVKQASKLPGEKM